MISGLDRKIIKNSLANLGGQFLYPLLSIVLVPFYLHYLGIEGFGLVSFFSTLIALLGVATRGLGAAVQREIARRDGVADDRPTLRGLVGTVEVAYWVIGILVALVLVQFSGFISTDWIKVSTIPQDTVKLCLIMICLRVALAFPSSVYQAVFVGLQEQVLGNVVNAVVTLVMVGIGVSAILIWKSVLAFYIAEVFNGGLSILVLRHWVGKVLPPADASHPGRFRLDYLKQLWALSVGLIWTSGIGLVLTQMDRMIISKLLPVMSLGIYSAAIAPGRLLGMALRPYLLAIYPQCCQVARTGNIDELGGFLLNNAKVTMIVCMAVGLPLASFSGEVLQLWTRNAAVAQGGASIMSIYIYGNILLAYASVLYQGQIVLGVTRFGVIISTISLVWFPVSVWYLVKSFGLVGAAWAWLLYSGIALVCHILVTLIILLERGYLGKYFKTALYTTGAGVILVELARYVASHYFSDSVWGRTLAAVVGGFLTFSVCSAICFGMKTLWQILVSMKRMTLKTLKN